MRNPGKDAADPKILFRKPDISPLNDISFKSFKKLNVKMHSNPDNTLLTVWNHL